MNAVFRPPLLDPYEDIYPLNRIPATTRAIPVRINPYTAESGYAAKNERISDVESHLTDRISKGQVRPTFYCPISKPQDNSVLPDLEMVLPSVSASAGTRTPFTIDGERREIQLDYEQLHPSGNTGFVAPHMISGDSGYQDTVLHDNRPSVSASSGHTSVYHADIETPVIELFSNRPNVSVSAGYETNYTSQVETSVQELLDNRPNVSASAGMNTTVTFTPLPTSDIVLESKIDPVLWAGNPEVQYRERMGMDKSVNEHIHSNKPAISYAIRPEVSYRERNEQTYKPHFRERLQPIKSYGKINTASAIPKRYIETQNVRLKSNIEKAGTPKSRKYRFR